MNAAVYDKASVNFYCYRSFATGILKRNTRNSTNSLYYKPKRLSPHASELDNICTVENIHGCRIHQLEPSKFRLEFLVSFTDSSHSVWVPAKNVAEDVRTKFSKEWWILCREETESSNFSALVQGSGEVLVKARDIKSRSPLHYACGIGNLVNVKSLLENEAEVDAHDCEGYTSLHIAAGYLNTETVETLLRAGADPELEDDSGRSALNLVETLKAATPASTTTYSKRSKLETLSTLLRNYTFEEVVPSNIVDSRITDFGGVEYLVEWMDGYQESWVSELDVSDDLIRDYNDGFEFAGCKRTFDSGKRNELLVQWKDTTPPSWEPKVNIQASENI